MERNREARRVPMAATGNGFSRRRHRARSFRHSKFCFFFVFSISSYLGEITRSLIFFFVTEEEIPVEFPEVARFRDRGGSTKKDRDREREREKERGRDRLNNNRSKRRRGERVIMMQGNMDEDDNDDTSDESVNDDEEYDEGPPSSMKMLPPASNSAPTALFSSALINHHNGLIGSLHHQRKSFPPTKVFRLSPLVSSWKATDEMIGMSVPRKARSKHGLQMEL